MIPEPLKLVISFVIALLLVLFMKRGGNPE